MDDDKLYVYLKPVSAAGRWVRLHGELPGQVKAIDYERLHMSMCDTSMTPQHDIGLEKLDEFRELSVPLLRAKEEVGWPAFSVWLYVRGCGYSVREAAESGEWAWSKRTIERRLSEVDGVVREHLIERHQMEGYAGRDLLQVDVEPLRRTVEVWLNNEAWEGEDD